MLLTVCGQRVLRADPGLYHARFHRSGHGLLGSSARTFLEFEAQQVVASELRGRYCGRKCSCNSRHSDGGDPSAVSIHHPDRMRLLPGGHRFCEGEPGRAPKRTIVAAAVYLTSNLESFSKGSILPEAVGSPRSAIASSAATRTTQLPL